MLAQHHNHPEKEERLTVHWKPLNAEKFETFPDSWKPLIIRAKGMQETLGVSDGSFTGPIMGGSVWNLLFNGNHRIPTGARGEEQITEKLVRLVDHGMEQLRRKVEDAAPKLALVEKFVERPELERARKILKRATDAAESGDEAKVAWLVAPSQFGKTTLITKLQQEGKVHWLMKATPSMRRSYKRFLRGIASALNLRGVEGRTADQVEDSIVAKIGKAKGVLAIQELQRLSDQALEFLKTLLNDTSVSLLISMLPGQYESMLKRNSEDMQQFVSRSVGVVLLKVEDGFISRFHPQMWANCPNAAAIKKAIRVESYKGGGVRLVKAVCADIQVLSSVESRAPELDDFDNALKDFRRRVPTMNIRLTEVKMMEGRAA